MQQDTLTDGLKTVVIGNSNAGKTSLLGRFAIQGFDISLTTSTTAVAFVTKSVLVGAGTTVKMHLWDTAGSEIYHSLMPMYYRNAKAAILCYDITDSSSFYDLEFWVGDLAKVKPNCRLYLCGCKRDLPMQTHMVSTEKAKQYAEKISAAFFETSALTGENVTQLFHRICLDQVEWNFKSITSGESIASLGADSSNKPSIVLSDGTSNNAGYKKYKGCSQQCKT